METAADIIGAIIIVWGVLTLLVAVAQKFFLNGAKKSKAFNDPFFDDFHKGASVIPLLALVWGVVLIVGGILITRIS